MRIFQLFGRPEFLRSFHGWATLYWCANYAVLPILWSKPQLLLAYTAFCSVYANKVGHWSSWQASRVEVKQDEELEETVEAAVERVLRRHGVVA